MADDRIPRIAIAGGGMAGWMAAAALANAFKGRGSKITLIDLPQTPSLDMSEASLPTIRTFNDKLGIAEGDFIRAAQATFKLGTEFKDWSGPGKSFFHPFGHYGTSIETVGFHHCWFKMRTLGDKTDLAEYSLASVAASLDRFSRPVADSRSVLSSFSYGFHFDSARYVAQLRDYALARGVCCKPSDIVDVKLRSTDGFIDELVLDNGERVQADLYIDCSSASGVLIEGALRTGYEDWGHWLPCNRAIACHSETTGNPRPATEITTRDAGWQWCIPLQRRTSHGYVYSDGFTSDEAARTTLLSHLDASVEPVVTQFTNGRRRKFWNKNCVALGEAAGFLEPLESTTIHLIQNAVTRLLQMLPGQDIETVDTDEYNRLSATEFEQIRDFLILHYRLNGHGASSFWDRCRDMPIPDTLAYKIELFKSRGRVALHADETFFLPNWLAIFVGLNILPRRHHPFADGLDIEKLKHQMHLIRSAVRQAAETMPSHKAFIAQSMAAAR